MGRQALKNKYELEHVLRIKSKMDVDLERLQEEEKEAIRLRVEVEQVRRENYRFEELADRLRKESIEHERRAMAARESAAVEVARVTASFRQDVEAANEEVNRVRASLEQKNDHLISEIDRISVEAETAKEKYQLLADEALEHKQAELAAAKKSKDVSIQGTLHDQNTKILEQHRKYEFQLEELVAQHERTMKNAREDTEREMSFVSERLNMSIAEGQSLRLNISQLEKQVEIATTAAQAAIAAAAKAPSHSVEKVISTQAFRESIVVLQEQLQERESRIEKLEEEATKHDPNAAALSKDLDHENMFLRELLSVRVTELDDIVSQLLQPNFNRHSVRNAAIRLKANIEMEQQERERISRRDSVVVGYAKGALGNLWKGKARYEDPGYVSLNTSFTAASSESNPSTPSTRTRQGFLTGLLTPPTTATTASAVGKQAVDRLLPKQPTQPEKRSTPVHSRRLQQHQQQQQQQHQFAYDEDADSSILSYASSLPTVRGGPDEDDEVDDDDMLPPGFARNSPYNIR